MYGSFELWSKYGCLSHMSILMKQKACMSFWRKHIIKHLVLMGLNKHFNF